MGTPRMSGAAARGCWAAESCEGWHLGGAVAGEALSSFGGWAWPKQEDDGEENQMKRRKGANADALDQVDSLRWENQAMNV